MPSLKRDLPKKKKVVQNIVSVTAATKTNTPTTNYDMMKKWNNLPHIDNSIFTSDEYLHAIGEDSASEDVMPAKKKSRYGNMGISSQSQSIKVAPPVMPDYESMTPTKRAKAREKYMLDKEAYQKDRKAESDSLLKARRKEASGRAIQWAQIEYTGDNTTTLRPCDLVRSSRLKFGDNLMYKEYVKLRIAEESMLRGINIKLTTSMH